MFMKKLINILGKTPEKKKVTLLFLGLSNAGKSTLLDYLIKQEFTENLDLTMGANIKNFSTKMLNYNCIDLAGQKTFRVLWNNHIVYASALIFVIDSVNFADLQEVKEELHNLSRFLHENNYKKTVLILANKYDLPEALDFLKLQELIDLDSLDFDNINIFNVSIKTGLNLSKAFSWLENELMVGYH